jgi:hypothetical protein
MSRTTRLTALIAPSGLVGYGLLRLLDGRDGNRGPGLAWDLGHIAFLVGIGAYAVLAVAISRDITPPRSTGTTGAPTPAAVLRIRLAAAATVLGASLFLWVIVGDLFPGFKESAGLPDAVKSAGPPAFVLGFVATLFLAGKAGAAPRAAGWTALAGFALIIANEDLMPIAGVVHLLALAPLAARRDRAPAAVHPQGPGG